MRHARIIGWINGRPIPAVMGGNGSDDGGDPSGDAGSSDDDGAGGDDAAGGDGDDAGYPADTPVAEMTAEQQAAYWKAQSRKHESRSKERADYDDVKKKAEEYEKLRKQQMTDHEKAVEEAKEAGRKEALATAANQLVDARIEAAAAGRIDDAQLQVLLDGLDRTRFLNDDGTVDADKVKTYVAAVAPAKTAGGPDLGQGRRQGGAKAGVSAGRDRWAERHGKKD